MAVGTLIPTPLAADLDAALRRLKLAAVRRLAPEVLVTARTRRWAPDELLRTLLEAELTARDASNTRARLPAAGFPVTKTLEGFDISESSIPRATFDYLASLEQATRLTTMPSQPEPEAGAAGLRSTRPQIPRLGQPRGPTR